MSDAARAEILRLQTVAEPLEPDSGRRGSLAAAAFAALEDE
ncbi:MAG TPA: hypothetical protein VF619_07025 [Allosphingosinicella sp.]|jgi:hypothetical protein